MSLFLKSIKPKSEKTSLCIPTTSNKTRIYQSYPVTSSVCPSQAFRFRYTENIPQYYFPPFWLFICHMQLMTLSSWSFCESSCSSFWKETGVPDSRHHIAKWSKIIVVDKRNQGGLQKSENMLECNFNFKLTQIDEKWRLQWLLSLN